MDTHEFEQIGTFILTKEQKDAFKRGDLWKRWLELYPDLFDEKDRQYLRNQAKYGYGFVEIVAAIFLMNSTGYKCILGSYGMASNPSKNEIVSRIVPIETWELIYNMMQYHSQPPDLFVYKPDETDYFFCEVKGPKDRLRATQIEYFKKLEATSKKPIYIIKFIDKLK